MPSAKSLGFTKGADVKGDRLELNVLAGRLVARMQQRPMLEHMPADLAFSVGSNARSVEAAMQSLRTAGYCEQQPGLPLRWKLVPPARRW